MMALALQYLLNALQLGSVYALIALGYTMVYGILTMINFAHGDIFMVGSYLAWATLFLLGIKLPLPISLVFLGALLFTMLSPRFGSNHRTPGLPSSAAAPPGCRQSSPPWGWGFFWKILPWPPSDPNPGRCRPSYQ